MQFMHETVVCFDHFKRFTWLNANHSQNQTENPNNNQFRFDSVQDAFGMNFIVCDKSKRNLNSIGEIYLINILYVCSV